MRTFTERDDEVVVTEAGSEREPFGIGQGVSVAIGIFFVVLGAVGLARAGLEDMTSNTVEVAGLGMTPLAAMVILGLGVIAMLGGASRTAARGVLLFLGPLLIAVGVIALMERVEALGWNDTNGIVFLLIGVIAIAAAVVTPRAVISRTERDVRSVHLP